MKITLNCRKVYERLKGKYIVNISTKKVKVYIPNGNHIDVYGRSMSITQLMYILCTGRPNMKPRNFPVDAPNALKEKIIQLLKEYVKIYLRNTQNPYYLGELVIDYEADKVALKATTLIKQWLFDGSYYQATAPNKPKTIRNKGSDVPLVHTGRLVNSITHKIEDTK